MKGVFLHAPKDLRVEDIQTGKPEAGQVRVKICAGGICGSDLHYYTQGGFGAIRIKEPMTLGHEVSGIITELGEDVTNLAVGDRVSVNPSKPCGKCIYCQEGHRENCMDMQFMGSAMRFPHAQGAFRQELIIDAEQAVPCGQDTSYADAAFAEPLSVALHAISEAGSLAGKRVMVVGAGTIGCLVILAARWAGALEITASDISDYALEVAKKVGADRVVNIREEPDAFQAFTDNKGYFDTAFECSGSAAGFESLIPVVRPKGTLVQIGQGGDAKFPISGAVTKELLVRGSFRFDKEFGTAVALIKKRAIDLSPLLTGVFQMQEAVLAFETALDKSKSVKVQLDLS
ncbi:L-idonate 5-dehydrogenase [uncultured Cohaesibacter sp.]|uniref:L-idonate 5-dehydrogenase n=1 Tax=uncultured Cohaesibacter sp. TaxID=1002546 RepID=UPI0029311F35|nr:L-idonate 5-dehydrogenase [uncultured Cohaesibacter sp.]